MTEWNGDERRENPISEDVFERLADRAADRALAKVYEEVGKNVLRKLAWLTGVVIVAAALYLAGKGYIKP